MKLEHSPSHKDCNYRHIRIDPLILDGIHEVAPGDCDAEVVIHGHVLEAGVVKLGGWTSHISSHFWSELSDADVVIPSVGKGDAG